jgi:sugar/nucleoside kinase (ribokinase family)
MPGQGDAGSRQGYTCDAAAVPRSGPGAALALERLAIARCVLEGGEARGCLPGARPLAAGGGKGCGGADEAADQKRAQPPRLRLPVHATIVEGVAIRSSETICTLGDLLVDVIVRSAGPLAPGADSPVETMLATGGQAANVAAWAAELGAPARCIARSGDDAAGELARSLLAARGVELVGPVEGRTGIVVALVGADGERTMATDRGASPELAPEEVDPSWLEGCSWLHVSGYSLLAEPIAGAALAAGALARAGGASLSVDLSSWSSIRDYGADRFRANLEALGPDVVFANEPEWEMVGGAYALAETAVVKRGSRGVQVRTVEHVEDYPPLGSTVQDTTGAGDALAAGFLVGGIGLGLEAAGRCVGRLGAVP